MVLNIQSLWRRVPIEAILSIAAVGVVVRAAIGVVDGMATCLGLAILTLVGFLVIHHNTLSSVRSRFRWHRHKSFALILAFASMFTLFVMFTLAQTTNAQLLVQTANAICGAWGDTGSGVEAAKKAIDTVFWIVRGFLILWIAFAGIQMLQNRDDREQMQQIARLPALAAGVTIIIDVTAVVVAGTGGACV
jgi:hypothetical protein